MASEDHQYDGYFLKPLVEGIVSRALGGVHRVSLVQDPGARGFQAAKAYLEGNPEIFLPFDLVLFLVDNDQVPGRRDALRAMESRLRSHGIWLLTCAGIEEVEVWLMAGHPEKLAQLGIGWPQLRKERKPSAGSFRRFMNEHGDESVGEGRKRLMTEALPRLDAILRSCGELDELTNRIQNRNGRPNGVRHETPD